MPTVKANGINLYYEQQGSGDPLVLIPFLTADNMCYAFQVAEYAKHYTCITLDLRGTGQSDKPETPYTTETLADDVAGLVSALGIQKAHFAGLSLGAAVSLWMGAKYPDKVKSISVHAGWDKSDAFLKTIVEQLQVSARAMENIPDLVLGALFPWCFTPDVYVNKPEFLQGVKDFVRSRPAQSVTQFMLQSNAVLNHDVTAGLSKITAPTLLTVGKFDMLTSTRFTDRMKKSIKGSELIVWDDCAHAPCYERVEDFNTRTLGFLKKLN